jgi:peptide/nickel transport system permease protein
MPAVRTLLWALLTLFLVSLVTFLATSLTGADAARAALGRLVTPEQVEIFRQQQGLGEPLVTRYLVWLGHALQGDWGISLQAKTPVTELVLDRAARSVVLAVCALIIAVPIAFLLGALAAIRPGGKLDQAVSNGTLLIIGLPEFVVGLGLLYLFAVWLRWLPPNSTAVGTGELPAQLRAYVLPMLTLVLLLVPYILRMVRSAFREVIATHYIQAAIARGVPTPRLLALHVLPNTLGPVINVIALSLAEVLAGVVVVETVFGFPGLGQLTVFAVSSVDYPVIQACVMVAAVGFVAINMTADALVVLTNPRLRRTRR